MRPRLSVYSDRVAYERLGDFVQDYMMMSHIYQLVVLMTQLLKWPTTWTRVE